MFKALACTNRRFTLAQIWFWWQVYICIAVHEYCAALIWGIFHCMNTNVHLGQACQFDPMKKTDPTSVPMKNTDHERQEFLKGQCKKNIKWMMNLQDLFMSKVL